MERDLKHIYNLALKIHASFVLEAIMYGNDEYVMNTVLRFWEDIGELLSKIDSFKKASKEEIEDIHESIVYAFGKIENVASRMPNNEEKEMNESWVKFTEMNNNHLNKFKKFTEKAFALVTKFNENYEITDPSIAIEKVKNSIMN